MATITFKAKKSISRSCEDYRAIDKQGDLQFDTAEGSDDVIILYGKEGKQRITIDCNKKTGVFSLKFRDKDFMEMRSPPLPH
jgi:hypothetical protein